MGYLMRAQDDDTCRRCSEALATAAHDLKAPLALLRGYIELLASPKLGPLQPNQEAVLKEMKGSADLLGRFADEFLTYYRVQAGLELSLAPSDLNACVGELISLWSTRFRRKEVALEWVPGEVPERFAFDSDKLQHVLANLLDNACKFTPAGGKVTVETSSYLWERRARGQGAYAGADRRSSGSRGPNCARIDVCDTGPGIAPEDYQEVFHEFSQSREPEHIGEGMGLGLAIARRLTELHGGKIWVESLPGKGSRFSLVLPFRR